MAVLSGARSDCFVIDTDQQERVVGIQFRPGGAFPFFPMPVSEIEGLSVTLDDLWPRRVNDIRERLLAAASVPLMLAELERCLLAQLARTPLLHPAVSYALKQFEQPVSSIATVISQIGLSSRRFIELFHREVGLTPKVFCRVRRFQQVLEQVHAVHRTEVNWVQIALDCGYYDQPHFIHDFRSFSGLTPCEYQALATPHLNHVPLP